MAVCRQRALDQDATVSDLVGMLEYQRNMYVDLQVQLQMKGQEVKYLKEQEEMDQRYQQNSRDDRAGRHEYARGEEARVLQYLDKYRPTVPRPPPLVLNASGHAVADAAQPSGQPTAGIMQPATPKAPPPAPMSQSP